MPVQVRPSAHGHVFPHVTSHFIVIVDDLHGRATRYRYTARVATKLSHRKSGGWMARKRIPAGVQEAYATLYGVRWEER